MAKINMHLPFEYRLPLIYIIIGSLWILFSDDCVLRLTSDQEKIKILSLYKGWLYVIVTGIMLFYYIKRELKKKSVLYNQLLKAKEKADESDALKTAFLSNLSHYIRTPLNGILGFVSLLKDRDLNHEKETIFLSNINERSKYLLNTLTSIIELSKIQEKQIEIINSEFSLNDCLKSIVDSYNEVVVANKNIQIVRKYNSLDKDIVINTDLNKFSLIINNLLSNAINFTKSGEITVSYQMDENNITISITDSGLGISPKIQKYLFTKFMSETSLIAKEGQGMGIGLYLSGKLSELLKGKLYLEESTPNGSTFCLRIPLKLK